MSLERVFKEKQFDEEDILNWCQEVETLYIADPDGMVMFQEVPIEVDNGIALLPPNIYKLKDVYQKKGGQRRVSFRHIKSYLRIPDYKGIVYLNYIGTPLDDDCYPLIHKDHQAACETYCKINSFEEDMMTGKINSNVFFDWKQRFDGMIQGAKVSFRDWDGERYEQMNIIIGSQIPKIGFVPMANDQFAGNTVNTQPEGEIIPSSSFYTKY
jgi:hypothetical protein